MEVEGLVEGGIAVVDIRVMFYEFFEEVGGDFSIVLVG